MGVTLQNINLGSAPGAGDGDPARTFCDKINDNNDALEAAVLDESEVDARVVAIAGNSLNCATIRTTTISDDGVFVYDFGADVFDGNLIISNNVSGNKVRGIFAIRAASNLAFCDSIASSGIATTTGILTGTTGAYGTVTISTATNNRLYVENRLGVSSNFTLTVNVVV